MTPSKTKAIRTLGIAYGQLCDEALADPACKKAADMVFEARQIAMGQHPRANEAWPIANGTTPDGAKKELQSAGALAEGL